MGLSKSLSQAFSRTDLDQVKDLAAWRASLVRAVSAILVASIPVAAFVSFPGYWEEGRYGLILLDVGVWLWAVLSAAGRGGGSRLGGLFLLTIFLAMTVSFYVTLGPDGPRAGWLVSFSVLAALLFGLSGALVATLLNIVMLVVLYGVLSPASAVWRDTLEAPFADWIQYVVNTNILALGCGLAVGLLLLGLDRTLRKERTVRAQLISERAELERAYEKLLEESAERQRLERSLRQAQKLEAVGRLAGGIAHDLNNVLVPIVGHAELLELDMDPESPLREVVRTISAAGERARLLVEQVLLFSRDVPPPDEHVDIVPVLQEVAESLGGPPDVVLHVDPGAESSTTVRANRTALFQVFLNIASNGLKAMEATGGVLEMHVRVHEHDTKVEDRQAQLAPGVDYLCVSVTDQGSGMEPEIASRVFEPFFTTRPFGEGTGLGLATSHGIVAAFEGCITLQTEPGAGSCFRVYLPQSGETPDAARDTQRPTLPDPCGGRVLLVDDNPHTLTTVQRQLEHLGFEVRTASSGPQALEFLSRSTFDLLISDLQMPEMNGLELCEVARRRLPGLPMALATGYADSSTYQEAERLGIREIISKPFSTVELARALSRIWSRGSERIVS